MSLYLLILLIFFPFFALFEFLASEHIEWALFLSAFISSTVLPGGSEVILSAALVATPDRAMRLLLLATCGNVLGGMVSYAMGRFFPQKEFKGKAFEWLNKYGAWALIMSWLPFVGDILTLGAGWLRLNPVICFVALVLGKFLRYASIAYATLWVAH